MEILLGWHHIDPLTYSATIRVGSGMQRLVNIADEMDQEGEVAGCTPFVIIALAKATGKLVDFGGDAIPARTA